MKSFIAFLLLIFLTNSLFADKSNFKLDSSVFLVGCEDMLANISNMESGYVIGYISGINDATIERMGIYGMMNFNGVSVKNVCQDFVVLEGQEQYKNIYKKSIFNYIIRKRLAFINGSSINEINKIDSKLKEKFNKKRQ